MQEDTRFIRRIKALALFSMAFSVAFGYPWWICLINIAIALCLPFLVYLAQNFTFEWLSLKDTK
jgi:hypothetical protein